MRHIHFFASFLALATLASAEIVPSYNASHTKLLSLTEDGSRLEIDQPLFSITLGNGQTIDSTAFSPLPRKSARNHDLIHRPSGLACRWKTVVTPDSNYLRHVFTLKATKPVRVSSFSPILLPQSQFKPTGDVLGSPLATDDWFAAMEYPMAFTETDTDTFSSWSPGQLDGNKWSTLEIPAADLQGEFQLQFKYTRGSQKLQIRRVALYSGKKLISEDIHDGTTGSSSENNVYTLDTKKQNKDLRVVAEVRADQSSDSFGDISIIGNTPTSRYQQGIRLDRDLERGDTLEYSSVFGHRNGPSMRRSFLSYLESERARPYKMFLHYNSWYDICHSTPRYNLTSENCSRVIEQWQKKFTDKHGVQLDSYVFDDGWDDYENLWQFREDTFPDGFTPQAKLAKEFGTNIGVWFSPFGGYGGAKSKRIKSALENGYEVNGAGLSLAGENYYKLFETQCLMMMEKYEANYFKFDGLGGSNPAFIPDVEAAYRLMQNLRKANPSVYINLTTGTWASPFFLLHGDSTWRGGGDVLHRGTGNATQKWLNYRDGETYTNIVKRGPLFPLNSLMIHGVVFANRGEGKSHISDSDEEFAIQAWSSFASGSQLQEFYISEDRMNDAKWQILADSAKWGLKNESTLKDVHWIGGNPYQDEIYGWASLSEDGSKAILCIRNPSAQAISHSFPLLEAIETDKSGWKLDSIIYSAAPDSTKTSVNNDALEIDLPAHKLIVIELTR